ncbi:dihydrofolate reductase [Crocinitomicaceae bacterium CZZ-1]|uniref:Dihydrofolate reductase n=1 Tax=Taishania pollutisoli TaxID=2766479 RepID=A0A8J6PEF3_9FLAO|nr:dihydrofolate reductase [Taishania pollutisoli]MBC9813093.1 dihydrofolate reductase [Taishania pollutisoli]MBX2948839.1 dihydrofolate reductase [Crocinitomicaceae bacterium]NGF75826.1 dihydrofolate reductase [Fluviicola sp. SGL-29]
MRVALIVAMDREGGIGKNNDLMWHLPADMRFFKATTTGHIVVLGRKNYESIPERFRPLPDRENAVLTRNKAYIAPGCIVFNSLEACLAHYQNETERTVFIIGGGEIYQQALAADVVDELYITHVDNVYDADTFFPKEDLSGWHATTVQSQQPDEKHEAGFEIIKYTRS